MVALLCATLEAGDLLHRESLSQMQQQCKGYAKPKTE